MGKDDLKLLQSQSSSLLPFALKGRLPAHPRTLVLISLSGCMLVFRQPLGRNSWGAYGTGDKGRGDEGSQSGVSKD